ncbi:MAG: hypothetical protein HY567_01600 [Candidatus Kerfeldbacteria bacterium]|nr:hypothetical protein [Candidatus Kerfeldbacteria bacterium]
MGYAQEYAQSRAWNSDIAKLLVLQGIDTIESEGERRLVRGLYESLEKRIKLQEGPGIAAILGGVLGLIPLFLEVALLDARSVMMPSLFHSVVWAFSMIFTFCAAGAGFSWLAARILYFNAELRRLDAVLRELSAGDATKVHLVPILREHEPQKAMLLERLSGQTAFRTILRREE